MSRWSVNTHTFSKVSGSVVMNSLLLDDYLISGSLTKNLDDTSKVKFSVPDAQGKDLIPGATLVDVKHGNDRKFFGTVSKKTLNNLTGIYDFEAVGVLGSYQFMPNYEEYGINTIESYIATEMSRFKGTASSPYDCDNPWDLVYTGHNEIPSTYGDIETENLGLIPTFDLNLQKTSANAYEFLRLITRSRNYLLPSSVSTNKTSLFWYEEGEKAYFKRILGTNDQTVDYDDNLISYTYENTPQVTKYYAKNTVEGAYPPYGQTTYSQFPVPFNFKVLKLPEKNDKTAYSLDELYQAMNRAVPSSGSFEAYAYDKHIIDESIPWFDMSKKVRINMILNGESRVAIVNIVQIVYDFCDSSKDRVKLGRVTNTITVSSEQQRRDFEAELQGKLNTSGGTMTGALNFVENGQSATVDANKIELRDRIFGTCNLIDQALIEQGGYSANGVPFDSASYVRTPLTSVKGGTTYKVSYNATQSHMDYIWEYNAQGENIRFAEYTSTFTTLADTAYVAFRWTINDATPFTPSDITSLQLEKGSSASPYVPYTMDNVELTERVRRKTGTLTANVGSFDEAYCRQSGDTVDIHGWIVGLSTSDSSHANAITVSGVSLPSVPIRFVFTCWLNNGIASYAGYGVLDTYGNITFVKPVANANKVSFTITYVV